MSSSKYHRLECIGEGTYGRVYKSRCTSTGRLVAIKRLFQSQEDEGISATTLREIAILNEISHENIVELIDVLFQPPKLTLVFQLCEYDLKKFVQVEAAGRLSTAQVMSFTYQMLAGIAHLHDRSIMHRDLKPQNLLITKEARGGKETDQYILKICDFGLARVEGVPVKKYSHDAVTLWYRPPDVIMGSANYGFGIDMWSAGCIFAEMIAGSAIFQGKAEEDQLYRMFEILGRPTRQQIPEISSWPDYKKFEKVMNMEGLPEPKWESWLEKYKVVERVGEVGIDLLKAMLQYDPKQRITATEALRHPYFAPINEKNQGDVREKISAALRMPISPSQSSPATPRKSSEDNIISKGGAAGRGGGDIVADKKRAVEGGEDPRGDSRQASSEIPVA